MVRCTNGSLHIEPATKMKEVEKMKTHSKSLPPSRPGSALMFALAALASGMIFGSTDIIMSKAAYAAEPAAYPSQNVAYRDLNLADDRGIAKLHARIRRAAKNVCGDAGWAMRPRHREVRQCVADTTRDAMAQADYKIALYRSYRLATD
jgi:UrcA family protein